MRVVSSSSVIMLIKLIRNISEIQPLYSSLTPGTSNQKCNHSLSFRLSLQLSAATVLEERSGWTMLC